MNCPAPTTKKRGLCGGALVLVSTTGPTRESRAPCVYRC